MHSVRGELCFAETQYRKISWVETSLSLSKIDQNGTAQNTNVTFSEWNAVSKQTAVFCVMGSLGIPGDLQIILSAVDKGSGHSTSSMDS